MYRRSGSTASAASLSRIATYYRLQTGNRLPLASRKAESSAAMGCREGLAFRYLSAPARKRGGRRRKNRLPWHPGLLCLAAISKRQREWIVLRLQMVLRWPDQTPVCKSGPTKRIRGFRRFGREQRGNPENRMAATRRQRPIFLRSARISADLVVLFANLLAGSLLRQCLLHTASLARLQVVGVTFDFFNDVFRLDLTLKAAQGILQ